MALCCPGSPALVYEIAQAADEPVDLRPAVGIGNQRHDATVIGELNVDLPLVPQPIVGLVAGDPDGGGLDHDVLGVRSSHARPPRELVRRDNTRLRHLELKPLAQELGAFQGAIEEFGAFAHKLPARSVDARQKQRRGARRFLELEAELEPPVSVRSDPTDGTDVWLKPLRVLCTEPIARPEPWLSAPRGSRGWPERALSRPHASSVTSGRSRSWRVSPACRSATPNALWGRVLLLKRGRRRAWKPKPSVRQRDRRGALRAGRSSSAESARS